MKKILLVIRYAFFAAAAFSSSQVFAACDFGDPDCVDLPTIVVNPTIADGNGGGGGGLWFPPLAPEPIPTPTISPLEELARIAEEQRQATCRAASADWSNKNCNNRRIASRPSNNYDINFNFPFPDGIIYDYMRGSVLSLHQALFDDVAGNVWSNFNDYISRMYQTCEANAGGLRAISVPVCREYVDVYFGQNFGGGFTGFEDSQAARDAYSSRYGQVCVNLAAVRFQNQCN